VTYEVVRATATARPTAVIAATTTWNEYPDLWPGLLSAVHAAVTWPDDGAPKGRNVMLYRDGAERGQVRVEVGVELDREAAVASPAARSALPAGEVAATVHTGDYAGLGAAHRAVIEWCAAHGLTPTGPRWEVYGHWSADPAASTTEVFYLLAPR
jgi:effector-binding domain-containing protein